jgi:hypothetical protein
VIYAEDGHSFSRLGARKLSQHIPQGPSPLPVPVLLGSLPRQCLHAEDAVASQGSPHGWDQVPAGSISRPDLLCTEELAMTICGAVLDDCATTKFATSYIKLSEDGCEEEHLFATFSRSADLVLPRLLAIPLLQDGHRAGLTYHGARLSRPVLPQTLSRIPTNSLVCCALAHIDLTWAFTSASS